MGPATSATHDDVRRLPLRLAIAVALALVAGACSDSGSSGGRLTLDEQFGRKGVFVLRGAGPSAGAAVARHRDGSLVAVGWARPPGDRGDGDRDILVVRLRSDGTPERTFGSKGVATVRMAHAEAHQVVLQSDDKLVVAGSRSEEDPPLNGERRALLVRLSRTGQLDSSFGEGGVVELAKGPPGTRVAALHLVDEQIVVAVATSTAESFTITRLGLDGRIDAAFGEAGRVNLRATEGSVVVDPRQRLVVTTMDAGGRSIVRRLTPEGVVDPTFGTDGVVPDEGGIDIVGASDSQLVGVSVGEELMNSTLFVTRLAADGRSDPPGRADRAEVTDGGRWAVGGAAFDGRDAIAIVGGEEGGDALVWLYDVADERGREADLGVSPGFGEAALVTAEHVVVVGTTGYGSPTPRLFLAKLAH